MSDPGSISRLDKLRALEAWLDWQLHQTRARIREVEAQERQGQQEPRESLGGEPSGQGEHRVEERRRPRTPDWGLIEAGIGSPATEVHRGDCWAAGKRLQEISRERAVAELADTARACDVCRPDRVLGTP